MEGSDLPLLCRLALHCLCHSWASDADAKRYKFIIMVGSVNDGVPRQLLFNAKNNKAPAKTSIIVRPVLRLGPLRESNKGWKWPYPIRMHWVLAPFFRVPSLNNLDDNTRAQKTLERLQRQQEPGTRPNSP
jgi:hypothetical protein